MAARSANHTITDDLLDISVRIKRESGVTHPQIQAVIDQFASQEQWQERTGGIGFPLVEDIPQDNRSEFMAALAELTPPTRAAEESASRRLSAADIWPARTE